MVISGEVMSLLFYIKGDANGYAIVKLYTEWNNYGDSDTQTVLVPARSTVKVTADLFATDKAFDYGAEIIDQWKG
jgi:hypothetical protein